MQSIDDMKIECKEEECAWWEAVDGRCAILDITRMIAKIYGKIPEK